jgi:hypothetical protein
MTEFTKLCMQLQEENEQIKNALRRLTNEETQWSYEERNCLFDVREYQKSKC